MSAINLLLGSQATSELEHRVRRVIEETPTLRLFVERLRGLVQWVLGSLPEEPGSVQRPCAVQKEPKTYRVYRPKWGWRSMTGKERVRTRSKPGAVQSLVDCTSGHGRNSVWLGGIMVVLTRMQFALICVLYRNAGKVHRDNLPGYLSDELKDPSYSPENTTVETLKCELQRRMRKAGRFTIRGRDRLYELIEPEDFVFIDYAISSQSGGYGDDHANTDLLEKAQDLLRAS